LLDPYGKCVARPPGRSREAARKPGDNAATVLKSVVVDPSTYDWEGDTPLGRPFAKTIIYEMHVAGFTRHPQPDPKWSIRVDGKPRIRKDKRQHPTGFEQLPCAHYEDGIRVLFATNMGKPLGYLRVGPSF
jgi:glycogen operon protein